MSAFFERLARRALGSEPVLAPRLATRFEPPAGAPVLPPPVAAPGEPGVRRGAPRPGRPVPHLPVPVADPRAPRPADGDEPAAAVPPTPPAVRRTAAPPAAAGDRAAAPDGQAPAVPVPGARRVPPPDDPATTEPAGPAEPTAPAPRAAPRPAPVEAEAPVVDVLEVVREHVVPVLVERALLERPVEPVLAAGPALPDGSGRTRVRVADAVVAETPPPGQQREPSVTVTIGRVEVVHPPAAPAARPAPAPAAVPPAPRAVVTPLPLEAYLRGRREARR